MIRKSWGLAILCMLALPLFLTSCGDDNNPSKPDQADLTVLSITWSPASPQTDEPITVTITVANTGEADAAACATRLKVNGTTSCAAIATPAIAKTQQATVTCDIGGQTAGAYTLEATVDVAGAISESDESNNSRTANLTVAAPPTPDLLVQSITFSPDPAGPDDPVTAHVTVRNQGTAEAVATVTSTAVDGSPECSSIATASVPAGGTVTVDCELGTLEPGSHAANACADAGTTVTESDETNNCLTADFTVSPPDMPDLTIESVTFTPAQPATGEAVTAHVVVRNLGAAAAEATITSTEVDGTPECSSIATVSVPAGGTVTVDCELGIFETGAHTAEACADAGSAVTELNETNNCLTANFTVSPPDTPDLTISSITFTPAQPTSGEAVTAHIVVQNQGTGAAAASVSSTSIDGTPQCASIATAAIPVGQSVSVDCDLGTLSAGTHAINACADAGSAITESVENNNCLSVDLTVVAPSIPDLIVDSISFTPAQPTSAEPVTAHVVVRNQGTGAAAASITSTSVDGTSRCSSIATATIPAGETLSVDCALGTLDAGTYSIEGCADAGSTITESSEANNCLTVNLDVTAVVTQADLVIDEISITPPNPTEGQPVSAVVTVRNAGGTLAGGSKTRVRLDGASTCAEINTSSLPEGSSVIVNCNLGTATLGNHTVEACADIAGEVTEGDETNNCASTPFTVTGGVNLPAFPVPDISTCVNFDNTDPNALAAQQVVQLNLNFAAIIASVANSFLLPLQGADWTDEGGGCYTWTYDYEVGCTAVYRVCRNGDGWEWTLTLNGNCDGSNYSNWVALRGTMDNETGTSGALRLYDDNTTTVISSWTWIVSEDGKSGTWSFYDGDVAEAGTLSSQITWAKNTDNSQDVTWIIPESSKTETHVSEDCKTGFFKEYVWTGEPAEWHIQSEINWENGHGSRVTYDENGQVIDELTETW